MGMFDDLRCKYPLPVPGFNDRTFQTKDTPEQYLDMYEISEDGQLFHEEYDIEDRSDPLAPELERFIGCGTRVNQRFVECPLTGEIRFYTFHDARDIQSWIEFSAYFANGKLKHIELIENTPPKPDIRQPASNEAKPNEHKPVDPASSFESIERLEFAERDDAQ